CWESSESATDIVAASAATGTSLGKKPTEVITSVTARVGTEIEKLPSAPVVVACEEPLTATVAPTTFDWSATLVTLPVMVLFCASRKRLDTEQKKVKRSFNLLICNVFWSKKYIKTFLNLNKILSEWLFFQKNI